MNRYCYIFPCLALTAAASSALAGELPSRRASQNDRVRACAAYGAGFVYSETANSCIKVSGSVEANYSSSRSGR